jgi:peptidoglycan/LPS O-acetylase OafA/YrhL
MDALNAAAVKSAAGPRHSARLAEIEVLRTIAVMLVLVHHLAGNLTFWPTNIGDHIIANGGLWTGVDLFFAVSGFVIARSLLPQLAAVSDWVGFTRVAITFWIARAWRLLPSAWLWLTVPLILCLAFNRSGAYGSWSDNWAVFIAGVLDLQNFHEAEAFLTFGPGTAFVQWSLSLEEQFYLLLPFAAFFFGRRLVVPLLFVALAGFVIPNAPITHMLRLWPVAFGVLLAIWSSHDSYQQCAPTGLAKSRIARISALAILVACLVSIGSPGLKIVTLYQGPVALVSVILVWLASYDRGYLWQEGLSRRVMVVIAARSYSLYLVHIPVYFAIHEIWFRRHGAAIPSRSQAIVMLIVALPAAFALAELNHRVVERPLRDHGRRLAAQYRARTTLQMEPAV